MPADSDRIGKFIRMLGSSADAEVLKAARDLVSELKADGFDLHTLARGLGNGKGKAKRTAADSSVARRLD